MAGWHTPALLLRIYHAAVVSRHRGLRLFSIACLSLAYLVATSGQLGLGRAHAALALLAVQLAAFTAPRLLLACAGGAAVAAATALVLAARVDSLDDSTGHRGGAEGFKGKLGREGEGRSRPQRATCLRTRAAQPGHLAHRPCSAAPRSPSLPAPLRALPQGSTARTL